MDEDLGSFWTAILNPECPHECAAATSPDEIWLGDIGSNPDSTVQSRTSYRWTTAGCCI